MAKKKRSGRAERDAIVITNGTPPLSRPNHSLISLSQRLRREALAAARRAALAPVLAADDRRRYHPNKFARPAGALKRSSTRLVARPGPNHTWAQIGFAVPRNVAICQRRKLRKEVMFATGAAGRGYRRKKRRNQFSQVRC